MGTSVKPSSCQSVSVYSAFARGPIESRSHRKTSRQHMRNKVESVNSGVSCPFPSPQTSIDSSSDHAPMQSRPNLVQIHNRFQNASKNHMRQDNLTLKALSITQTTIGLSHLARRAPFLQILKGSLPSWAFSWTSEKLFLSEKGSTPTEAGSAAVSSLFAVEHG